MQYISLVTTRLIVDSIFNFKFEIELNCQEIE